MQTEQDRFDQATQNGWMRVAGIAAGGGTVLWILRRRRKRKEEAARRKAQAVAARAGDMARHLPGRVARGVEKAAEDDTWRTWAVLGVGAAWLLFRMAEIRQLRKINKGLRGTSPATARAVG